MALSTRGQVARIVDRTKDRILRTMNAGYRRFERAMVREHLSGPTTVMSISVRTGAHRRSLRKIGPLVAGDALSISRASIGAEIGQFPPSPALLARARAHEFGARIRPKRGPWLAIPLDRTKAGVARMTGRTPGYWVRSKRGNPVRISTALKRPVVVLVKQVNLPPRTNFRTEWRFAAKQMRDDVRRDMELAFRGKL